MDEFLEDHMKRARPDTYLSENNTYGKHLEVTLNRRLYLGQIEESRILFVPKQKNYSWSSYLFTLVPTIASLWAFGISLTYTYPRCIRAFRYLFPNVKSFFLIHLGIAPWMMFINLNLLGIFKGLTFFYFDKYTGGEQISLINEISEDN
ncbi:unnamed protein product [Blepharisma stoltei]|uniref:Uncharacterized protein n=1 Tax=Blepharisma stoltei TaxID=1481888 RepID=A0AAU9ICG1_9CILI|nr:unnamed protein product [Blepharisma stoltei]